MSRVAVNGLQLYHESQGSGEPLLLIMGWGGNAATWKPQLEGLAQRYHVITFDNRGVGRTSAPRGPYTTAQMAGDAAGLLDALGIERAHVLGISLGGMIAQELALAHPDRVDALILGCTTAGGPKAPGRRRLQEDIAGFHQLSQDGTPDLEWFSEFLRHLWTEEALAKSTTELQDFVFSIIRFPPSRRGLRAQADAVSHHDTSGRLRSIRHRTLVITGAEDTLIDPRNSLVLTTGIPNAELFSFPNLKHAFHLEEPELVNGVIVEFIERAGRFTPGPKRNGVKQKIAR